MFQVFSFFFYGFNKLKLNRRTVKVFIWFSNFEVTIFFQMISKKTDAQLKTYEQDSIDNVFLVRF